MGMFMHNEHCGADAVSRVPAISGVRRGRASKARRRCSTCSLQGHVSFSGTVSLSLDGGIEIWPSPYKRRRRDSRQFVGLNLVEAATVDPPLATEFVAGNLPEQGIHVGSTIGVLAQH